MLSLVVRTAQKGEQDALPVEEAWRLSSRNGVELLRDRLHVPELRNSSRTVISGFLIPVFLALLSPLATFSLNPKHSLTGTSEGHLSIIFLSEEASVFSSGNKFRTRDNWSGSCSLSVNVEMYPLKKKMQFLLLKIQVGFLLLYSCYKEFSHRSILSLDFTEE